MSDKNIKIHSIWNEKMNQFMLIATIRINKSDIDCWRETNKPPHFRVFKNLKTIVWYIGTWMTRPMIERMTDQVDHYLAYGDTIIDKEQSEGLRLLEENRK